MTRTHALAAVLLTLLVGGCSSDGSDDASSGTTSPTAEPGASAPPLVQDPIRFGSHTTGVECQQIGGRLLEYELMTVRRPVTLDGLDLGGSRGVRTGTVYVAPRPQHAIVTTGGALGTEPGRRDWDTTNWRKRVPLVGAEVAAGDWYLFVPLTIHTPGRFDTVDVSWTDDAGTGTSSWTLHERYRQTCR